MIEVRHLDKYYAKGSQKEVHAVRDTTLQLPDTGIVALFGASGCGKTTLLNIIGGLDTADSGEVLLDGARVTPKATETRNRHIGYIFQNYHLIADETVYENVALSLRLCGVTDDTEIEKRTMAALEAVEMEMYCRRLPGTLSGGQQQRVAIARALVKNPHLILADEPTGNLDEQNTVMVMELLRQVARDHLVLLVTHEHDLLPYYCDRIIEISDGTVVSERENDAGDGYRSQNKSDVFLGDLPRTSGEVGTTFVEFFGLRAASAEHLLPLLRHPQTSLTPHSLYSVQDAPLRAIAARGDAPLSIHFMESPGEAALFEHRGPLWEWYAKAGFSCDFLHYGSPAERLVACVPHDRRVTLVHDCCITQRDIDIVMGHFTAPVWWCLCPRSNRYISGLEPPVELLRRNRLNICLGTDSLASNDRLSVFEEMRMFPGIPLPELLAWAAGGGAQALGMEDALGEIAPGRRCGLTVISGLDYGTLCLTPASQIHRIL